MANRSKAYIQGFSRNEIMGAVSLQKGQILTENLIQFKLNQHIDEVLNDLQNGQLGRNEIQSVSVSSYPLAIDIEYLVTILYREQAGYLTQ